MKDLFSSHSAAYAQFRPTYPPQLFDLLRELCPTRNLAWDCGTGTGQVAGELAQRFKQVKATDISINQMSQAVQILNIQYTRQASEKTNFPNACFDLVTVGQAVHWFNFKKFYSEVARVLKKDGIIAIFGYGLFTSNPETDEVIRHFYRDVIGPYWQPERKYLDEAYKTIPFPFKELEVPELEMKQQWSFERLTGYLNTWSAVRAYEMERKENPVELVKKELWKQFGEVGEMKFPLLLRVGRNR